LRCAPPRWRRAGSAKLVQCASCAGASSTCRRARRPSCRRYPARGSPDFGKWVGLEISAEKWNQILVPAGFAHGFVTLEPDTEVIYKVTDAYSPLHDRSIRFDDPAIGIAWPVDPGHVQLSTKDRGAPLLGEAAVFE
jgi:hypothetical protein